MKIRATRTIIREYEAKKSWYPEGSTFEQIIEIDRVGADDDPEMFFGDADSDEVKFEIIEE